ncbi:MAG TPA: hypothetical protein ENG81_04215 [Candidatus Bathyarchaeota archaeon]|nr:hypothetical protein [Candidatus Bathyarchaeota archaeon]
MLYTVIRHVRTVCLKDCYDTCLIKVILDANNYPTKTVGDELNKITQGFLCLRGIKDIERTHSERRVLHPYRRAGRKLMESLRESLGVKL